MQTDYGMHVAKGPRKRKPKAAEMEMGSVRIEPAENGFTVIKEFRPKPEAKGPMSWPEPERSVFESVDSMLKHVRDCFKKVS